MLAVLPPRRHTRRDTSARMAVDLRRLSGGQQWAMARAHSSPQAHRGDWTAVAPEGGLQTRTPDPGFPRQSPPRVLPQGPLPAAPPAPPPPVTWGSAAARAGAAHGGQGHVALGASGGARPHVNEPAGRARGGPESASPARAEGAGAHLQAGDPWPPPGPALPRGALAPAARAAGRMGARGLAASPPARRGSSRPWGCEPKSDSWSSRLAVMLGSPAGHSPRALTPRFGRTPAAPGAADPPPARPAAPAQVRGGGGCPGAPGPPLRGRITGQRFSFAGLRGRGRLSSKRSATYLLCLLAPGLSFLTSDWRTKKCYRQQLVKGSRGLKGSSQSARGTHGGARARATTPSRTRALPAQGRRCLRTSGTRSLAAPLGLPEWGFTGLFHLPPPPHPESHTAVGVT